MEHHVMDGPNTEILESIKLILRRDLKLGHDIVIEPDMLLVGGPTDLDSIDILLLVSSIEKHFGIKIPNEAVGRAAFENVGTLVKFVELNREKLKATPAAAADANARAQWLARLPHGPEFRFVSELVEITPGQAAVGRWVVKGDEPFLKAHFPGNPIVPGVLLTEAMAQLAGLAAAGATAGGAMLAHVDVRFVEPVRPPASVELRATIVGSISNSRQCDVLASVGGRIVARGTITLAYRD